MQFGATSGATNADVGGGGAIIINSGTLFNTMQTGSAITRTGATILNGGNIVISTSVNLFGRSGLGGTPDVSISAGATLSIGTGFDNGIASIGNLSGAGTVDTAFGGSNSTRTLNITQATPNIFAGTLTDASSGRVLALGKTGSATLALLRRRR